MGIGVGVGAPVIIIVVVLVVAIKKRKSGKSMTELTGKSNTERQTAPIPNGNKVVPTSENSADEGDNSGKSSALGHYKPSEPTLTSATMLTHPDVTTDEAVQNKKSSKTTQFK